MLSDQPLSQPESTVSITTESNSILLTGLSFISLRDSLPRWKYQLLKEWLHCEPSSFCREGIYSPLLEEITSCLPQISTSTHFYMIHQWTSLLFLDLTLKQQKELYHQLMSNQDMRDQLIIGLGNFPIHPSSLSTPAPESSNCTGNDPLTEPKSPPSPPSPLLTDTLLERLSNLRLKVGVKQK